VLDTAKKEGVICISRRDGDIFYITPAKSTSSPLNIEGVDLGLSSDDIVELVREGRGKSYF
jgi:hypothetical protein